MTRKAQIAEQTNRCLDQLVQELELRQEKTEYNMRFALIFEAVMIISFIIYSVFVITVTSNQIFGPIIRSIPFIKNDAPMPVEGAHELRILAYTYNLMYEAHRKSKLALRFRADHDALTGVLNRYAFDRLKAAADDGKVAFLIIDLDNFKSVNDNFGHAVGDKLLIKATKLFRENFRTDDRIFRVGGDEFVVIMFGTDKESENTIREKIETINKLLCDSQEEGLPPVSLSVGVAFGNKIDQELINKADQALYQRKQEGKAGVSFFKK